MEFNMDKKISEYRKNDKKWTTKEILKEARQQIDELIIKNEKIKKAN